MTNQTCGTGSIEEDNGSHVVVSLTDAVIQCVDEQFRSDFGIPQDVNLSLVIRPIIEVCQVMLQHFGYLTTLVDADGIYSDLVMQAVQRFQICHNEAIDDGSLKGTPLSDTGRLNKATYESLHLTLQHIRLRMDRLGLVCNVDPCSVPNATAFRRFISGCQKAWGLTLSVFGTLDKMTLAEIDRQLRLLNPNSSWV